MRIKLKNVKSFEMTLNCKHRTEVIKTKNQNRNMKIQSSERRNPSFTEIGKNADLYKPIQNKIITTRE